VHQRRGDARRDHQLLLDQVLGHHRTGRAHVAADVHELHVGQVAGRLVVVEDRVNGGFGVETVPAGVRLAVDHDDGLARVPADVLDGDQVQVEQLDHGPVLGAADEAVAGQSGVLSQADFHQVRQPQHRAEAVRVRVDVGDEGDEVGAFQTGQELV